MAGRSKRKWEGIFRMDLKETGANMRNWIDCDQDRDYWRVIVNAALSLRIPQATELVR